MNTRAMEIKKEISMSDVAKNVLHHIGYYYHDKYAPDTNKAYTELRDLGISHVFVEADIIYICLDRPGLLIGVKGSNIDELSAYLLSKGINKKIHLIENRETPLDLMTSWQYMYMDWDEI